MMEGTSSPLLLLIVSWTSRSCICYSQTSFFFTSISLTYITSTGEFLSQIYGMDSIMINQFMFGIRSVDGAALGGHVQNMETKERWGWRKDQIESFETTSLADWLPNKIGEIIY